MSQTARTPLIRCHLMSFSNRCRKTGLPLFLSTSLTNMRFSGQMSRMSPTERQESSARVGRRPSQDVCGRAEQSRPRRSTGGAPEGKGESGLCTNEAIRETTGFFEAVV